MPPKRTATTDTVASSKRFRAAIDESAEELLCPITQALPLDPVLAEDGKVYERVAIEDWLPFEHLDSDETSDPVLNGAKFTALVPSVHGGRLMKSGAEEGHWSTGVRASVGSEATDYRVL